MQLNVFKNHLSLIVDFEKYCDVYHCQRYDKLWYGRKDFLRHTSSRDQTVTQSFPGGITKVKTRPLHQCIVYSDKHDKPF